MVCVSVCRFLRCYIRANVCATQIILNMFLLVGVCLGMVYGTVFQAESAYGGCAWRLVVRWRRELSRFMRIHRPRGSPPPTTFPDWAEDVRRWRPCLNLDARLDTEIRLKMVQIENLLQSRRGYNKLSRVH
jgi:hypothetical protein